MLRRDRELEHWIVAHRFAGDLWVLLSRVGEHGAVWLALGAVLAVARRRPSILGWTAAADAAADLLSTLLKVAIPRARPDVSTLVVRPASHAFPSGHAATAFACAVVLAALEPRLRAALYVLAALIALSRLEVGVHFPLDVLGGAALGLAVGWTIGTLRSLRALRWPVAARLRSRREPRAG